MFNGSNERSEKHTPSNDHYITVISDSLTECYQVQHWSNEPADQFLTAVELDSKLLFNNCCSASFDLIDDCLEISPTMAAGSE
ncbi:hypothetical protein T11_10759 [Trichinella zimbabwensis]|uniref:Uncharacterized protein n=1 Tax=Trichinella zimbabwensis TaxID=268475 RepID=A0A0V1HHC1_9BILA|nr:hypothetical protein T11_10759 [Trichinella zimbabwensis]